MTHSRNDNTLDWWNDRYSIKDTRKIWASQQRLKFYDMAAKAIPKQITTILDVGSGFGFGPAHLATICKQWKIEGLDFSTKACAEAVIKTHCLNIIKEDIPGTYDYITCIETLEHFDEPMVVLEKMCKTARKAVVLTVPYMGAISPIHITSFGRHSFDQYEDVYTELSSDKHFMLVVVNSKK